MARLALDLGKLDAARATLRELTDAQATRDRDVAKAQSALDAAVRAGQSPNFTVALAEKLKAAQAARSDAVQRQRDARSRIDLLADGLIGRLDPSRLVESLDGKHPIALLPMRIETRYVPVGRPDRLRIRVYPDDINTIDHTATPTAGERQAAMDWWDARFAHDDDEAARILRDLSNAFGRGRATWVVRALTPDNPIPVGDAVDVPHFPETDVIDARAKSTRAVLLPDRWCAIGYAAGRREVFRVWGKRIPDELLLSPDWLATDKPEAILSGDRAWMVDFDAALANGMAIEVPQSVVDTAGFVRRRFNLATDLLERLVVVGLEWTKTAEDSAAELADLFGAHRDSGGFGFAPLGTPTNNTEAAPSGYSQGDEHTPPEPADAAHATELDALQLCTWAFGIAPEALPADNIANAHLAEQRTALHMLNALWRGTFGHYLIELWNPPLDEGSRILKTSTVYNLRRYAVSYLRPGGPLPLVRVGKQPYGILPMVGKRFVDPGNLAIETGIGKILAVLRPMWELAEAKVPLLKDGDVAKAKDAMQTSPWSQAAFYRDKDSTAVCMKPSPFADAQQPSRNALVQQVLAAVGVSQYWFAHIYSCSDFRPDPPYAPGYLAGVPWVLADTKDPKVEAPGETFFPDAGNYLKAIATASLNATTSGAAKLYENQSGPALLQALAAYSVQEESGDAVTGYALGSNAVGKVASLATSRMPYVEAALENEAMFTVQTPKELAQVAIPAVSGKATLGEHVSNALTSQAFAPAPSFAHEAATALFDAVSRLAIPTRNLGAVKVSLDYLSGRPVGELNVAFRTTLDAFSYRLDAWITARANRRLEQMRDSTATGVYIGGFAFVENLQADLRPDSEGYLLAPSLGQAASASILRSGFLANHESGAFDIALDSRRTRRALDLLQGLSRDQPLAALYGYRIERGLRDALLGKFIWPLRLAYPWRPAGAAPSDEPKEAIGARDVVDGVALLEAWELGPNAVRARLATTLTGLAQPAPAPTDAEWATVGTIVADALDLADSVSDLLLAEGMHQIVLGNLDRSAAAMAIVDKQSLPFEPQVNRTPRGGASYTQRLAAICAPGAAGWPVDRRATAEPAVNGWLAAMLGDPDRYRFVARVHRGIDDARNPIVDAVPVVVGWAALGLSPLSAVLLATAAAAPRVSGSSETGFRATLVSALSALLVDPDSVTGLDIQQEGDAPDTLGLGHFEAFATSLKTLLDKARPLTRKDLVQQDDTIEAAHAAAQPDQGEWSGVDLDELEARAKALIDDFAAVTAAITASANADAFLAAMGNAIDFLPPSTWPSQVLAIDAAGADPLGREARADDARAAMKPVIDAKTATVTDPPALLPGQAAATFGQDVKAAIDRIQSLLGKDFPVLPRCSLGAYATEFSASLADQAALTVDDPWRINGWLTQIARVRDGADRFATALSAHETLVDVVQAGDFKLVQFPHRAGQAWAALPEAWVEDDGVAPDPTQVPEELQDYVASGKPYKDIQRVAPHLTIALHAPAGLDALADDTTIAGLVCDEWPELIPDPYQTAGIGFHYDAPGARPPQTIVLALPPKLGQPAWTFDDLMDVIHETFDLAKLRGVRPRDLGSGLGALLPGSYLPHAYTDDLPSVQLLKMMHDAQQRLATEFKVDHAAFALGKI